jgi:hypothetical protein
MTLLVVGLTTLGRVTWLHHAFLPLCLLLGLALLGRPAAFIVFTLAVWIWAPCIRRLVDWESTHHALSPVLAAPVLLTGLAGLAFPVWRRGLAAAPAFALFALPLGWASAVGLLQAGVAPAAYGLLAWAGPIVFGLYVLGARESEPGLEAVALGGLSLLAFTAGIYGIFQFIDPTIWDRRWMINSGMPVLGEPLPYRVRVFGSLNSPVPFAAVMVAGIMATTLDPRPWRWLLAPPMVVALLLSLVRSEWLALAMGGAAVGLVAVAQLGRVIRMVAALVLTLALGLPILAYEPIQRAVVSRVQSFSAGSSDVSLRERTLLYERVRFDKPIVGSGLGSTDNATRLSTGGRLDPKHGTVDSALIQLGTSFGLPMAAAFLAALGWLALTAVPTARRSSAGLAGLAIVAASLSQLPSYNMLISAAAVLLHLGLALSLPPPRPAAAPLPEDAETGEEARDLGWIEPPPVAGPLRAGSR